MEIHGRFVWNKSEAEMLAARNLESGGEAQKELDNAVIRYCEPYVPYDSGTLMRSPNTASDIGNGEIVYPGPYAHYQYYGLVYGPNIPISQGGEVVGFFSPPGQKKSPTGAMLEYNKEHSALSGSFWFERMKADRKDDLLQEVCDATGGKHG